MCEIATLTPASTEAAVAEKLTQRLYHLVQSSDPALAPYDKAIADAFHARGNAYMDRGAFHLAIADFSRALHCFIRHEGANTNRGEAMFLLDKFLKNIADPSQAQPAAKPQSPEPTWPSQGYAVAVDLENILFFYPPTEEGKQRAIDYANEVATDEHERFVIDNRYYAESDEFDTVVYAITEGRTEEIHRAPPICVDKNSVEVMLKVADSFLHKQDYLSMAQLVIQDPDYEFLLEALLDAVDNIDEGEDSYSNEVYHLHSPAKGCETAMATLMDQLNSLYRSALAAVRQFEPELIKVFDAENMEDANRSFEQSIRRTIRGDLHSAVRTREETEDENAVKVA